MTDAPSANGKSWLDANLGRVFPWNLENLLAVVLLALAILSRFYGLGDRVVSHDEVNHLEPSYTLSQGGGFQFSPMTHGPLQMHLIALSFVLFGDNDFTARLPAAVFSIATVGIGLFLFRRYLGRTGALAAGLLLLISPYMLYYGRYQRNEAFIVVWSLLTLYAILRYLERGEKSILILYAVVNALHFTDKTTAYMYAAAQAAFLLVYFFVRILRRPWSSRGVFFRFLGSLAISALLLILAVIWFKLNGTPDLLRNLPALLIGLAGLAAGVAGVMFLIQGVGEAALRQERSLDLALLILALTIPLSAAVPMRLAGFDQTEVGAGLAAWLWLFLPAMTAISLLIYHFLPGLRGRIVQLLLLSAIGLLGLALPGFNTPQFFIVYYLIAAAVTLGMLWNPVWWSILAAVFFGIYIFFFTTVLTNWNGLADGVFKFLEYWMSVQLREGHLVYEPWYYYLAIEIPIYEYLPALGALFAFILCAARGSWLTASAKPFEKPSVEESGEGGHPVPVMPLFLFWALFNLAVFTYASEKMPQQTMLIAAPMILATAWGIGCLVEAGHGRFLHSARNWILVLFAGLAFLTVRTAYTATYINYDYPFEYMAYAHGAPGPKIVLSEIERLSRLTTGGTDLIVAYDNDVRYPYWWYMRHYKNKIDFDVNPTADILRAPIIAVGQANNEKVAAIAGDQYVSFRLPRLWWHNQDFWDIDWDRIETEYKNNAIDQGITDPPPMSFGEYLRLSWGHIEGMISDPKAREAVFQIWLNRDFTLWSQVRGGGGGYTLSDWSLVEWMHVYIRRDVLGFLAGKEEQTPTQAQGQNLYELARIDLPPDQILGEAGSEPGQFLAPRGIAVAPDDSFYVADSQNNRIQHFDAAGQYLDSWGTYASIDTSDAPGGTFNEPWGVAVGADGSVYVADTWNHRIQKFTAEGEFVTMWGSRTVGEGTLAFYGPRAIAVDGQGRIFVADTGNKRIVVFDSDGGYLAEFGTVGAGLGNLDEPVGVAVDSNGRVFVADTWNRRVQIFTPNPDGTFSPEAEWPVNAWYGTMPENKPYLALDSSRHVYLSDPLTCRLMEFNERGLILAVWGQCGEDESSLSGPTGLGLDSAGGVWVGDSHNNRLVHYPSPNGAESAAP